MHLMGTILVDIGYIVEHFCFNILLVIVDLNFVDLYEILLQLQNKTTAHVL